MKTVFFLFLSCCLFVARAQQAKTTAPTKPGGKLQFYEVKEGETEEDIAKKFGITTADLEKWNNLDDPISEGRILYLDPKVIKKPEENPAAEEKVNPQPEEKVKPKTAPVNDESYHIVLPGETVYHISQVYKLTVQQLMDLNNLKTPTIKQGQRLRIKK